MQHRGQEGAGISVFDDKGEAWIHKDAGLVTNVFDQNKVTFLNYSSNSPVAMGHVRYSTSRLSPSEDFRTIQPFKSLSGQRALGHNGNIEYIEQVGNVCGVDISGCLTDSEAVSYIIDQTVDKLGSLDEALDYVLPLIDGAYSLLIGQADKLIGIRDPWGYRPLSLGRLATGGYALASETYAFRALDAEFIRDIQPGEIVVIDDKGVHSRKIQRTEEEQFCSFEYIYFAKNNSVLNGLNVQQVRFNLGRKLGELFPYEVDVVCPVLESGAGFASGYAFQTGNRYEELITKNLYAGRSFIYGDGHRQKVVRMKHHPVKESVEGKIVALIDDSIVRGTTLRTLVMEMKEAGAVAVYVLIGSGEYIAACKFGMDTRDESKLIAKQMNKEQIREYIGADKLEFLPVDQLVETVGYAGGLCTSCMTGIYPSEVPITLRRKTAIRAQPVFN